MALERTDYYNSNAPRVNGVSFAQIQQELIWDDELIAQQKADALMAHMGNMQCAINS
jgi:hypothetical protein